MRPTLDELRARIAQAFPHAQLSLTDDSHLHAGHAGAQGGAGHYSVRLIDASFEGLARVRRHRLVYDALADWMPDRVHALSIEALSPREIS
jgi:BolA family transcriptional regulator, general stress-responsive regulator